MTMMEGKHDFHDQKILLDLCFYSLYSFVFSALFLHNTVHELQLNYNFIIPKTLKM